MASMQVKLAIISTPFSQPTLHTPSFARRFEKAMLEAESIGQLSWTNEHVRESGGPGSVWDAVLSAISGGSQVGGTLLRRCTRRGTRLPF